MRMDLCVGAPEFWARAGLDIASARRRVLVQAMSFEGDQAGLAVAAAIAGSRAADRRVLVDDYTRININDRFVRSRGARGDADLQAEVEATDAMFRGLTAGGVQVRVTNRIGRLGLNYPARNHKKLVVADDVAFVGGINFSDHNFAWDDLMLRIEDPACAGFLAADFEATFAGRAAPGGLDRPDVRLISLDGRRNAKGLGRILAMVAEAKRDIVAVSPYLTFPFTGALAAAAARGVRVRLITPWANNKPIVRDALLWTAARAAFEICLGAAMSHVKALMIDQATLVIGSSNFDFASLAAEEELLAIVTDPSVVADFHFRVVAPALAHCGPSHKIAPPVGASRQAALRLAAIVAASARGSRRTSTEWGV